MTRHPPQHLTSKSPVESNGNWLVHCLVSGRVGYTKAKLIVRSEDVVKSPPSVVDVAEGVTDEGVEADVKCVERFLILRVLACGDVHSGGARHALRCIDCDICRAEATATSQARSPTGELRMMKS